MSTSSDDLLAGILDGMAGLDSHRGERGMVEGRRTSTPLSRRAPADLDALDLTDPRSGALAKLMHWAARIRFERRLPRVQRHTLQSEAFCIGANWSWALEQPWGSRMIAELAALESRLHQVRYGVPVRPCPVCGEPVRVDRFAVEHRACLETRL